MPGRAIRGSANLGRGFVPVLIAAAFSWALVLSASPQWHERVHPDANQGNHECAITLISAGNFDHGTTGSPIVVPSPAIQFSDLATLDSTWVASPFLGASIFEHAPPVFV